MVALLVLLTIVIFLTVDYFVQKRHAAKAAEEAGESEVARAPAQARLAAPLPARYRVPDGLYFGPGHTWVYLEESGAARVGLDDFAHSMMGDLTGVETLPSGSQARRGDVLFRVRHGERVAMFRSPVDGEILEVNAELVDKSRLIDVDPMASAWVYRIKPVDTALIPKLMLIGRSAKRWFDHEVQRLKVFLATTGPTQAALGQTLPDGGLPTWGLVDALDEQTWRKLRDGFFAEPLNAA